MEEKEKEEEESINEYREKKYEQTEDAQPITRHLPDQAGGLQTTSILPCLSMNHS